MPTMKTGPLALALLCLPAGALAAYDPYIAARDMLRDPWSANDAGAAEMMRREAEAGDLDAQLYMVHLLSRGLGVPSDAEAARAWRERALARPEGRDLDWVMNITVSGRGGAQGADLVDAVLVLKASERESNRLMPLMRDNDAQIERLTGAAGAR